MQDVIAMLISTALGTLVGLERQMGRKPAGLRTHVLVCLGSTLFVLLTAPPRSSAAPASIPHASFTGW